MMFQGCFSAIVTPFREGSAELDIPALDALVEWQLESGIDGIVACGSTGEAATLDDEEKVKVIRRVCEIVKGRVPVIAGTGNNCTRHSIELTKAVQTCGVDGVLLVAPYYNKPSQEGLFRHFEAVANEGKIPVIVYNIPGRSVVEILPPTLERLSKLPGIVGVKHAVDSVSRLVEVAAALDGRASLLAGDDPMVHAVLSVGGSGVISASATVIPKTMRRITDAGRKGDLNSAFEYQKKAMPFINALFLETNPTPAKAALKILGKIPSDTLRLPLVPVTESTRARLQDLFAGSDVD